MFKAIFAFFRNRYAVPRLQRSILARRCGHLTYRTGTVRAFGAETCTTMPVDEGGATDWCLECIGKMAIRCHWCCGVIFIGDPITLYSVPSHVAIPESSVVYNKEHWQVVGCLRMNCAETGGDRAGFWVPGNDGKGRVHRVMSPIEEVLFGDPRTFKDAVIVSDLSDMDSAKPFPDADKSNVRHGRSWDEGSKGNYPMGQPPG